MFSVSKCCCCCSLKYGVYTIAIINMVMRFCGAIGLLSVIMGYNHLGYTPYQSAYGHLCGWFTITTFVTFAALMGIAQKKPMLIYPYIVILILELVIADISYLVLSIIGTPLFLLAIAVVTVINVYYLICIISLYREIKRYRKHSEQQSTAMLLQPPTAVLSQQPTAMLSQQPTAAYPQYYTKPQY